MWVLPPSVLLFQTSVQVPSPANGVIEALLVPDGGTVEGGTPLFTLRKTGGKDTPVARGFGLALWDRG